jgi:hypothetical protein
MTSEAVPNLIKVQIILDGKEGKNSKIESETIDANDIKGCRHWNKGDNDKKVEGDITMIIMKTDQFHKDSNVRKVKKILINENCDIFEKRLEESKRK